MTEKEINELRELAAQMLGGREPTVLPGFPSFLAAFCLMDHKGNQREGPQTTIVEEQMQTDSDKRQEMADWRWNLVAAQVQVRTARRLHSPLKHKLGVSATTLFCEDCGLPFQAIVMAER